MINHSNCDHPSTKAGRAACRRGKVYRASAHSNNEAGANLDKVARRRKAAKASWTDPNAVGAIDEATLDDRIRASKVKPPASPVKVYKAEG